MTADGESLKSAQPRLPWRLVAAIAALALLRAVLAGAIPLVDDEAYYRLWSLSPALSYLDHPPMIAWLIAAGRAIAGDTEFGIRLGAGVAALVTIAAIWRTAVILFTPRLAELTLWLMLVMPLLAIGGIIITPDIPSVMFFALTLWSLAELTRSDNAGWWLVTGLFCGLGLISKYTNLFAGLTILAWLLWVPQNRKWFATWQLWAASLLTALLTLPVVVWNAEHGWASFTKQFGRVGHGSELGLRYVGELVGGLFALANPVVLVLAAMGFWLLARRAAQSRDTAATLIVASIVPMAVYFLLHALHDRVQGNWLGPIYPSLAICAAVGLDSLTSATARQKAFTAALVTGAAMISAIYLSALVPIAGGLLANDPTAQMRGWPPFAATVDKIREQEGARWIATSSFATTAQLAFALRGGNVPVIQLNERLRYVHSPPPDPALLRSPALYVDLARREKPEMLGAIFSSVKPLADLVRGDRASPATTYAVRVLSSPRGQVLND